MALITGQIENVWLYLVLHVFGLKLPGFEPLTPVEYVLPLSNRQVGNTKRDAGLKPFSNIMNVINIILYGTCTQTTEILKHLCLIHRLVILHINIPILSNTYVYP